MPVAMTYPIRSQPKMRSVLHWQLLAHDSASALASSIGPDQRVYVQEAPVRSDFDEAFETYFVAALQARKPQAAIIQGHDIPKTCALSEGCAATSHEGALYVNYGIQRVDHARTATHNPPAGAFTLLGTGVWLGHQAHSNWSTASAYVAAIPAGIALDLLSGMVATPTHTEVIVTVLAMDAQGKNVFRQDRSYYVDDADAFEYTNSPLRVAFGAPTAVPHPEFVVGVEP